MVKSMWKESIPHVHRSAFLCSSTQRMPTTFQWGQRLRWRQQESHRARISAASCWMSPGSQSAAVWFSGWLGRRCQCSSSPLRCSASTRSGCSESWPQDCREGAFGGCSEGARLLPGKQDPANRCSGGPWAHPRCRASWHIGLSQQFGTLPQWDGPAERCRSAPQESFGGPGAHPRCRASFHIELSQQFGSLPQRDGPAERCRSALQESFGGLWPHPRCRAP